MLGVSADTPQTQKKFQTKYDLPYTLLSDSDKKVCNAFGVIPSNVDHCRAVNSSSRQG